MLPPPVQGNPYDLMPPGTTNPEAWGCVISWNAYQLVGTEVIQGFQIDLNVLQGVPM